MDLAELSEQTVAGLVLESPDRARVFEQFGIDYCCGGKKTLREACEKRSLELATLANALAAHDAPGESAAMPLDAWSLERLMEDIVQSHHDYLRTELPRLGRMLEKVARVHGEAEPRLHQMRRVFEAFSGELGAHMMKEENILFPAILEMERTGRIPRSCFGSIAHPIRQMEHEHDGAGDALEQLKQLSDGHTPPPWACNTYRALLDGLHRLEQDMHTHVFKENSVLFPKALELEAGLGA